MRIESKAGFEVRARLPQVTVFELVTAGPKQDQINDEVHKKFLEIGHLIEERCREFAVEGEVTAYHPGPVVTTFEFKPSAGVERNAKWEIEVLYGVHNIRSHQVCMPVDPAAAFSDKNVRLALAPTNPKDFHTLAMEMAYESSPTSYCRRVPFSRTWSA